MATRSALRKLASALRRSTNFFSNSSRIFASSCARSGCGGVGKSSSSMLRSGAIVMALSCSPHPRWVQALRTGGVKGGCPARRLRAHTRSPLLLLSVERIHDLLSNVDVARHRDHSGVLDRTSDRTTVFENGRTDPKVAHAGGY